METDQYIRSLLPSEIDSVISNSPWETVTVGQSGDLCFRVGLTDGKTGYLKSYFGLKRSEPAFELSVIDWLQERVPVATVRGHGKSSISAAHQFILWNSLRGKAAHDLVGQVEPAIIVRICAEAAWKLHQLNIGDCSLDQRLIVKVPRAIAEADQGRIRIGALDASRKGWSVDRLKRELQSNVPFSEDLVFTHGDFCLPNLIANREGLSGFIDLGRAGVADWHQDIALVLRSLQSSLGQAHEDLFLRHYGLIDQLDRKKSLSINCSMSSFDNFTLSI